MNNFYDAFISYGRKDSEKFAQTLYTRLKQAGKSAWFDYANIPLGVDFQSQIDDDIEKAHNFLFVISPYSVNSDYCAKELNIALRHNKRIIPLMHVEEISREIWLQQNSQGTLTDWTKYQEQGLHSSHVNMHPAISKINWVWFREGVDDFEKSFQSLLDILDRHRSYVHQHTYFLIRALQWERKHQQNRYLLISKARQYGEAWLKTRFEAEQAPCDPTEIQCLYITESIKNAQNLMTQVFLAHAEVNTTAMRLIRRSLMREGITVWSSETDIQTGEDFLSAIERGIEQTDNVVYMLSPAALQSKFCQHELKYALSLNKRIVPILVEPTDGCDVPAPLQDLQYVDLTDNVNDEDYRLDESQLLKILQKDQSYCETHKVLLTQALKWERQNQNPSILLRGYNLRQAEAWLKTEHSQGVPLPTALHQTFLTESLRQPTVQSLDVFISYSRVDSDLARRINDRLQLQGYLTWFDQESIAAGTADFEQEIFNGIQASDNFLFILSPESINSKFCKSEVDYSASLNKRVITILYRDFKGKDLHPVLAKVQRLDFRQNQGDFNTRFGELIRTLDTDREYLRSHTKWAQQALDWDNGKRISDLLLRGTPYALAEDWLTQAEAEHKQPPPTQLQKIFIQTSQTAIEGTRRRKKRQNLILRSMLGLASMASVGLAILGFLVWNENKRANASLEAQVRAIAQSSLILSESNQSFEALLTLSRIVGESSIQRNFEQTTKDLVRRALWHALSNPTEKTRFEGHTDKIRSLAFSPNSQTFATSSDDDTVRLWSLTGESLKKIAYQNDVYGVHFSPDGELIVTRDADKVLSLWDKNGEKIKDIQGQIVDLGIGFSTDGQYFISKSTANEAILWSKAGESLASLSHTNLTGFQINQLSSRLMTRSGDGLVKIWTFDGDLFKTFRYPDFFNARLTRDGRWLIFFDADSTAASQMLMVNIETGEENPIEHDTPVNQVLFDRKHRFFVTYQWRQKTPVTIWSLNEKKPLFQLSHQTEINDVSISPNSKTLAVAGRNGLVKLWNLQGDELHSFMHTEPVQNALFSPDGRYIAVSGEHIINLWDTYNPFVVELGAHQNWASRIRFNPKGKTVVTASHDGTARLWQTDGQLLHTLSGHDDRIRALDYSPSGDIIATGSRDKTIRLWQQNGEFLREITPHDAAVITIRFSPDPKQDLLLAVTNFGTLYGWKRSGELLFQKPGEYSPIFSRNGNFFITANGPTIKFWKPDGTVLRSLHGHRDYIQDLAISPDGQRIGSIGGEGNAKLWSSDGVKLADLPHDGFTRSITFSPDGRHIATASEDRTVKLWTASGEYLDTLKGHDRLAFRVLFSPDGRFLASAGNDQRVNLWNLKGDLLKVFRFPREIARIEFSPDGRKLAASGEDNSALVWNLALDDLPESLDFTSYVNWAMNKGCDRIRDYLKTKPENDRDRYLYEKAEK